MVIDITDTAMQRQTRLAVERKYEDRKIVAETKAMIRMGLDPEFILDVIRERVHASKYNGVAPAS